MQDATREETEKPFAGNPILNRLPKHLFQFVTPQRYERYSAVNQATWRYVMRQNVAHTGKVAHKSYLDGLKKADISTETIPNMYGMNRILKEIGWAAVAVDGFIPPDVFMEFQAYNVLVISSDIRPLSNIEYTPAPDIIHESAGHAPIIVNPEYAEYLRQFGAIGARAISSEKDSELYEAIRHLSLLRELGTTPLKEVEAAEQKMSYLQKNMGVPSELSRIKNLHWWTVEYGLIGSLRKPKIYGAGILSSIGESKWCLSDKVKKLPYDISAADQNYDITKPQPQLYVTPDFAHLSLVLEEFAGTMGLRRGGAQGLQQLVESKRLGTAELNTGLQLSGVFSRFITQPAGDPVFLQTVGPTALAYRDKELIGHGTSTHLKGFGSPIGRLKNINLPIENMSPSDLEAYGICEGKAVELVFEGDILLRGEVVTGTRNLQGKIMLITFKNCRVVHRGEVLFDEDWGLYHLAVGRDLVAAYAGPADHNSFDLTLAKLSRPGKEENASPQQQNLEKLYQSVRDIREKKHTSASLKTVYQAIKKGFLNEWLLLLEFYELVYQKKPDLADHCMASLKKLQKNNPSVAHLIRSGLQLLS